MIPKLDDAKGPWVWKGTAKPMDSTDRHWERWGATDPYYAVVTHAHFRSSRLSEGAIDDFFRTGEDYVSSVFSTIHNHVQPRFAPVNAIDFGCGTGRLTLALASRCAVVGVDVSASMLREAEKNAYERGVSNVEFTKSIPNGQFDLVNSFIVFQHIPVKRGIDLTKRLLSALSPRGIAVLHYTYARNAPDIRKAASWVRRHVPLAHNLINVLQRKPALQPLMQMNNYSLNRLLEVFYQAGMRHTHLEYTDHSGHLGALFYLWR
jgi:2-polyprenyl-3-methyl-5-hydroxy-6-metoxy-1,4-benzoquinol methylase